MSGAQWELIPHQGIRLGDIQVTLGAPREEIRRRLAECLPALTERGLTINDGPVYFTEGVDCPELGVNIATQEEVGGDGDEIEWISLWRD